MLFTKVMAGAFYYVYANRVPLVKALSLPFIAFLVLGFIWEFEIDWPIWYLLLALESSLQVIFAITTHRIVLLGKESVPEWGLRSWSKRETFYCLHALSLLMISTVPLALALIPFEVAAAVSVSLGLIPFVGAAIALVTIFWVCSRLSLVFPGIAVDKGVSFQMSWDLTKDYQLLMLLVIIVCPVLLAIPIILLSLIPYTLILTNILINFISTMVIVFEVAALSMAYQLITSEQQLN